MTLKNLIEDSYGAETFQLTDKLKTEKMKIAKLKNQLIFLKRCADNKIIPKSMRVQNPLHTRRAANITAKYHYELLICAKNDAKSKFFQTIKRRDALTTTLNNTLSNEHMNIVLTATDKYATKTFHDWQKHLKSKFEHLKALNRVKPNSTPSTIKPTTLNLCDDTIPEHHRELLDLGPKFVPVRPNTSFLN